MQVPRTIIKQLTRWQVQEAKTVFATAYVGVDQRHGALRDVDEVDHGECEWYLTR
jgi:hypothetical protein